MYLNINEFITLHCCTQSQQPSAVTLHCTFVLGDDHVKGNKLVQTSFRILPYFLLKQEDGSDVRFQGSTNFTTADGVRDKPRPQGN